MIDKDILSAHFIRVYMAIEVEYMCAREIQESLLSKVLGNAQTRGVTGAAVAAEKSALLGGLAPLAAALGGAVGAVLGAAETVVKDRLSKQWMLDVAMPQRLYKHLDNIQNLRYNLSLEQGATSPGIEECINVFIANASIQAKGTFAGMDYTNPPDDMSITRYIGQFAKPSATATAEIRRRNEPYG